MTAVTITTTLICLDPKSLHRARALVPAAQNGGLANGEHRLPLAPRRRSRR